MSQRLPEADIIENDGLEAQEEPKLRTVTSSPLHPVRTASQENTAGAQVGEAALPQGFVLEEGSVEALLPRLARLERRLRLQLLALIGAAVVIGLLALDRFIPADVIVRQKLMESKEITLLDNDGNARLFIRMYSKVPVLQVMDSNGKPRMSLGLRFDDTPFIDLSDDRGRTRATLEMTEQNAPALRMFDENGNPTFNIN